MDSTVNALAWSTQEAGTGANAWIKYYADLISQARGEKDQRAHLSSAQAESNNSAAEAYDRIVSRANKRNERLCAWCGEEVGKSYATDGVYVYHQEPNKDCHALNMKAGIKCPRHCAWCGEEVGEAYGSDGCHVYHKEPDRDCYALMVNASRKRSGGRPAGGGYFFG